MTTPEPPPAEPAAEPGVDELLDRLEAAMTRLADGSLPLDELVRADEEQWQLVSRIQARLRDLLAKLEAEARET
jgi:uncharacterized coiled-coil protein SlyX